MFWHKRPDKKELNKNEPAEFEKGDITAIIIAAFTTIIPTVLLILAIVYLVIYFLFIR